MFQFPGFLPFRVLGLQPRGFPHSDTCGSKVVCTSPQLFAAYHVLRHLWEPRHPPCALNSLPFLNAAAIGHLLAPWRPSLPACTLFFSFFLFPVLSMNFLPEFLGVRTCRVHVELTVLPSAVLPVPGFCWQCRYRTALPPPPSYRARPCHLSS